jgi:hypothetical protein
MHLLRLRSFGVLVLFSLFAAVVSSQKLDEIRHTKDGTHLNAYHEAFQKQPAHLFNFDYFKNTGGVSARGSWKSITDHNGDQLAFVQNTYISCTKIEMSCIEATAQQGVTANGYPRAELQFYTVKTWTNQSLEAEDDSPICVKNTLTIEFNTARVVVADVLRQETEEIVKACANFGVSRTTTFQLW